VNALHDPGKVLYDQFFVRLIGDPFDITHPPIHPCTHALSLFVFR
jgi:hypothetical protein